MELNEAFSAEGSMGDRPEVPELDAEICATLRTTFPETLDLLRSLPSIEQPASGRWNSLKLRVHRGEYERGVGPPRESKEDGTGARDDFQPPQLLV